MPTDLRSLPLDQILRSRKRLRRERSAAPSLRPLRVAVLGGSTTAEVVDLLELVLLSDGFAPAFYQSEYNKFYEDATLDVARVAAFKPDLVWVHTQVLNVSRFPSPGFSEAELEARVAEELGRFQRMWESIQAHVGCQIIQNNFEHPPFPVLGNLDSTAAGGTTRFVYELNRAFARHASADHRLIIHDLNALSARAGHARWFDWERWFSYKILTTPEASWEIAASVASLVAAIRGRAKKCLILDLDNTLWGGVIGDAGIDKLQIGQETPVAEAYSAFQRWCVSLRERGVVLAVCSKNEDAIARSGFAHPDSILKVEHFSAFKANWEPKPDNIRAIAEELNLGLDSLVFVDDNPAERAIVRAQLPMVAVPEVGHEVAHFATIISAGRWFESAAMSPEDLARADAYRANVARVAGQSKFADYGEYLDSLQMTAEIGAFKPVYLERITQLINKTNQFTLTTRRYTHAEIEQIAVDRRYVTLYGRLADTFGDHGLISVIIGRLDGAAVHVDLWLMSCRVLKRDMELAMLDALVAAARAAGAPELRGTYSRTPKNALVAEHYPMLGFSPALPENDPDRSTWTLGVASYAPRNRHIKVN
jgi:FkbH-like protein